MPTLRYVTKPMKRIRRNTISAMRKTENGKMSSTLTKEYSKYCAEVRQLRQILKDTQKCFKDINQAGIYEGTQVVYAELSEDEEAAISEQTNRMPNIVILGQDNHAKVKVANAILQREVLPSEQLSERWRSVVFRYGRSPSLSLQLPDSYELVDSRTVTERDWTQIPVEDLILTEQDMKDSDGAEEIAVLEASIRHTMLKEGGRVVVVQSFDEKLGKDGVKDVFHKFTADCIPVVIYTITSKFLSQEELLILEHIRALAPHLAIFFVHISDDDCEEEIAISKALNNMALELNKGSNSDQDSGLDNSSELDKRYSQRHAVYLSERESNSLSLFQQLVELGFLSLLPASDSNQFQLSTDSSSSESYYCDCELVEKFDGLGGIVNFTRRVLERYLLQTISLLHLVHTRCLQMFILSAYDMARDMQITPRKLQYAKAKEIELYDSLMELAVKKQEDIRNIIDQTIGNMHDELIQKAADYDFIGVDIPESCEVRSARDLKICTGQIQELMLSSLNSAIAVELLNSVSIMKDSYTGVLTRCLESLEQSDRESADSVRTSLALREILHAAYKVEITVRAGASVMRLLLEKMKQLIHMMPWKCPPVVNTEFKIRVAEDMLKSLNSTRLANSICSQIKEKLRESHESFTAALRQLEWRHSGRLERTEELRLKVRKVHAPRVARLVLESTSQRDYLQHGMPEMGREVGRGQYGVVYSCERWAGRGPCAIKSVVPPDDKHWNDLALEYFYTKNVPEHDRLVALRGSVIDYTYCGGSSPAVLLIMDRLQRDFYAAIKAGLDWAGRLQVAVDVVEGIRYLHSQGLVHRDIKLKNVLLDKKNRGKLTDLGFCKPEAMMSGSIVGTPIHMAPELFSGKYDASVDVYAFGVLFWYTCAGTVRLPLQFEQCTNKEMLWTSVKRGVRPEQLPSFTKECWELMRSCWQGDPLSRPLLGNVHQQLLDIQTLEAKKAANRDTSSASSSSSSSSSSSRKSPSSQASPRNPSTRPMPSRSSNRPVLNIPVNI